MTATTAPTRSLVLGGDPDAPADLPPFRAFVGPDDATRDYAQAPDVARIAEALIGTCDELAFLEPVALRYLWRRKQQAKAGKAVLGTCAALTGLPRYGLGGGDFLVTLNWENCRAAALRAWQFEALVYRQLCCIAPPDPEDPEARPTLTGEDARYFFAELRRYGAWHAELEQARDAFAQLALLEG